MRQRHHIESAPIMVAKKSARLVQDERVDIAERLAEEQESFPQLTFDEIQSRTEELRHESVRRYSDGRLRGVV